MKGHVPDLQEIHLLMPVDVIYLSATRNNRITMPELESNKGISYTSNDTILINGETRLRFFSRPQGMRKNLHVIILA